jgi:hypothetical protein
MPKVLSKCWYGEESYLKELKAQFLGKHANGNCFAQYVTAQRLESVLWSSHLPEAKASSDMLYVQASQL